MGEALPGRGRAEGELSRTAAHRGALPEELLELPLLRAEIGDFAVGRQVEAVNPASVLGHERVVGNPRHRLTAPFHRT